MKRKITIYKREVRKILFRDYFVENEKNLEMVEKYLEKRGVEKYYKQGFSEEAAAHALYERKLKENRNEMLLLKALMMREMSFIDFTKDKFIELWKKMKK